MQSHARVGTDRSAKLAVAAVVALFGSIVGLNLLLGEGAPDRGDARASAPPARTSLPPPAPSPEPSMPSAVFPEGGELAVGRHRGTVAGIEFSFMVPWPGWYGDQWPDWVGGPSESMWLTWVEGPVIRVSSPRRVSSDPCAYDADTMVDPSAAELVAAVTRMPGLRTRSSDARVGGFPATRIEVTAPGGADCPAGQFHLWEQTPFAMRSLTLGSAAALWVVDVGGVGFVIDAEQPGDPEAERTIEDLVEAILFVAPFAPDGPSTRPPPPEARGFAPAGDLVPGWYTGVVDADPPFAAGRDGTFSFGFRIPTRGWSSSGPDAEGLAGAISRGTVPSADGATIRFSSPDRIARDPCAEGSMAPAGDTSRAVADAIAAIDGVVAEGPNPTPLGERTTSWSVVLSVPHEPACEPARFALWHEDVAGAYVGPRTPGTTGSTIRAWVFQQDDRAGFPVVLVEAETYAGASAGLVREIEAIVGSVSFFGG